MFLPVRTLHAQQVFSADSLIYANIDLIDLFKDITHIKAPRSDSGRNNHKLQFSILPAANGVPGGGVAIITSTNMAFYCGPKEKTSMSNISFAPYVTLSNQFLVPVRANLWLKNDAWNITGDVRYLVYPQNSWGLGGNSPEEDQILVDYHYVRVYFAALKQLRPHFFAGIGYDLDYHYDISVKDNPNPDSLAEQSRSSGTTFNLLYDNRKNSINPTGGYYAAFTFRANPIWMGSDKSWQSVLLDFRKYFSFDKHKQNVLGLWSYYWAVTNGDVPYLDLPSIGWDSYGRSGRGYRQNRYRSNQLLYFEAEYRRDITANGLLGFVAFSNTNSVTQFNTNNFVYWHPAAGAGLRIKFNKYSKTNVCIDYGFSSNFSGIYLGLGEAF